jgi:hypothetical protein
MPLSTSPGLAVIELSSGDRTEGSYIGVPILLGLMPGVAYRLRLGVFASISSPWPSIWPFCGSVRHCGSCSMSTEHELPVCPVPSLFAVLTSLPALLTSWFHYGATLVGSLFITVCTRLRSAGCPLQVRHIVPRFLTVLSS